MKVGKIIVSSTLTLLLLLSAFVVPAFAVSFSDTAGLSSEDSISKLVSLGVMKDPGEEFNPDGNLTGADFSYMASQVGLKVSHKGKSVKYSELAKVLANGLGLKAAWTNRSIDYLYYLDRKGVLDIDTDLDAAVTRAEAAVAFDRYVTLKGSFRTVEGIVIVSSDWGLTLNTDTGVMNIPFGENVSAFVSGQNSDITSVQQGSPVELTLNKNGEVAFVTSQFLDAEGGTLALDAGKLKIGDKFVKDVNLNAYFAPLPNVPGEFTFALFNDYLKKGVGLAGQAFFTSEGEVSLVYSYVEKMSKAKIIISGDTVNVETESITLTFDLGAEIAVKIDGEESTLDGFKQYLRSGKKYTATVTADANGALVGIDVTTTPEENK